MLTLVYCYLYNVFTLRWNGARANRTDDISLPGQTYVVNLGWLLFSGLKAYEVGR